MKIRQGFVSNSSSSSFVCKTKEDYTGKWFLWEGKDWWKLDFRTVADEYVSTKYTNGIAEGPGIIYQHEIEEHPEWLQTPPWITADNEPTNSPKCTCDLWQGCTCGVFKAEQKAKKK